MQEAGRWTIQGFASVLETQHVMNFLNSRALPPQPNQEHLEHGVSCLLLHLAWSWEPEVTTSSAPQAEGCVAAFEFEGLDSK